MRDPSCLFQLSRFCQYQCATIAPFCGLVVMAECVIPVDFLPAFFLFFVLLLLCFVFLSPCSCCCVGVKKCEYIANPKLSSKTVTFPLTFRVPAPATRPASDPPFPHSSPHSSIPCFLLLLYHSKTLVSKSMDVPIAIWMGDQDEARFQRKCLALRENQASDSEVQFLRLFFFSPGGDR